MATTNTINNNAAGNPGVQSTVLYALTNPQVNLSSAGGTYTDTVGNTYGQTASATGTTASSYRRAVKLIVGGKTSTGTATFAVFYGAGATLLTSTTTTSTSEVALTAGPAAADAAAGTTLGLYLKCSTAGGVVTVNSGGFAEADAFAYKSTGTGLLTAAQLGGGTNNGYPKTIKIIPLKARSASTFTLQLVIPVYISSGTPVVTPQIGSNMTASDHGTTITFPMTYRLYPSNDSTSVTFGWGVNQTAIASNGGHLAIAYDQNIDYI